jgi:CRISPR-associated endonuclease/helicase Cas3
MSNEPIAKTSGVPLRKHIKNLLLQAEDALVESNGIPAKRAFVIQKYKELTDGADFKTEVEQSAKWHDIGKTDDEWQKPCQRDFAVWQALSESERRSFRAVNLIEAGRKGYRHELGSLQIAREEKYNLSMPVRTAVAAHHGKLSRHHEKRWNYRPVFRVFWDEFNNESANDFPLSKLQESFDKVILRRYAFDGIRSWLQLIDSRASAAEDKERLPEFQTFKYEFPYKDEFGNEKFNPVQGKIKELWDEPFAILRAPTGAGKTDAALLWAKRQVEMNRADRLVIAMPTRFTANALSIAVTQENFKNLGDAGLYHSSAWYQRLKGKKWLSIADKRFIDKEQDLARILETPLTVTTIDHLCICLTATRETHHATFFGLANSCVVIDEADFYDDFTQLNIVVLLRALRILKVPVLLMSATVPDSAMELYRQSGFEVNKIHADESDYNRTRCHITRHKDAETPEDIEELLQHALDGEPTILYANTVARAQAYYRWFERKIEEPESTLQLEDVVLYHSRFIEPDKVEKENRLREMLGREAWKNGKQRGIAILTQIGEISVNISADFMISDLCPLDRLAQRVGRLSRFIERNGEMKFIAGKVFVVKPLKTNKNGDTTFYPAPYGEYRPEEGWQMSDALAKSDELLKNGEYSAKKFVDLVNELYPNLKESTSDALQNKKQLERLVVANWLILPEYANEDKSAEDSDEGIINWRSRDIPFQYTVFTGFENNGLDDDFDPPTNKAELREFEARYGVTLYAYEYHRARKEGKIEADNNALKFNIRGEMVTREYVRSPRYYDENIGLKLSFDDVDGD